VPACTRQSDADSLCKNTLVSVAWHCARARVQNSLRLFQYSWSPPAFGTGKSWEATRLHLLAAALLSRSDVVCLQSLSGEQAHWLKDAFDMQGYDSIISATPTALADLQQQRADSHA